jgi:NHLM bacteriocin system ABC transporter ATP-binding protein
MIPDSGASRTVSVAAITQRCPSEPQRTALPASAPLRLDEITGGIFLNKGRVDLFAVALADGEPAGIRHPLWELAPGDLLLGLPPTIGHTVIAVGHRDTEVTWIAPEALANKPTEQIALAIERWIVQLARATFGDAPAWHEIAAEPDRTIDIPASSRIYATRDAIWATPIAGSLTVGNVTPRLEVSMPIAAGLFLAGESDARVALVTIRQALSDGLTPDVCAGLNQFHALAMGQICELLTRAEGDAGRRILARGLANRRGIDLAVRQLAGVGGGAAAQSPQTAVGSPAANAFTAVAATLGIEVTRTPRVAASAESETRALARANGIGLRQVLLRGRWWRSDVGSLIGWRGEGPQSGRPVALVRTRRRGFRLLDPVEGTSAGVDAKAAAAISPYAAMLYRPLPAVVGGIVGMMRFAVRGIRRDILTIVAAAAVASLVGLIFPIAVGFLFETVVPRAETGQMLAVIGGLALAACGAAAFDLTEAIALLRLQTRLEVTLQPALMYRLVAMPVSFFRGFGTGDLTNRVMSIQTIRQLLADNTLVSFLSALFAITGLAVILFYNPVLALVATVLVAVTAVLSAGLAIAELRHRRACVELRGQEDSLVLQIVESIPKLRVAAGEARIFAVWAALFAREKRRFTSAQRYALLGETYNDVYPILATLVLFLAASRLLFPAINDPAAKTPVAALGLGAFLAINVAFGQLLAASTALARCLATTLEIVPLFERLRPLVSAAPEVDADSSEVGPLSGQIDISRVTFRYPGGVRPVIENLSLSIEPGSFVAIVGPSGSGKSTLIRLLLGFEKPENGDILYDGQSISSHDISSVRRQIGVVLQNSRFSTGSIFDNITGGLPYKIDDAWEAARLAGVATDIEAMPMGMHTLLIEGSSTLSGGQRQRLMIARALLGRPHILLFDEATSALDNQSQALVTEAIERLRTTRIVIAHRLSTIERADLIFVLEAGRVVESGNFSTLMAHDGLFARLARRQIL